MLPVSPVDQRDTHRLIPTQFADDGASVLARLSEDQKILNAIFELDNATNDRLLAESQLAPGFDARELVFGIPSYRIINATFCHPSPTGSRFNSPDRGAWYAGFELETSQTEVAFHKQLWLRETAWEEEEAADYLDYLADFRADFHDLRSRNASGKNARADVLSPVSYTASQMLAAELLQLGSAGIVYPSVRRRGGTCISCFRPVLVTNVRKGAIFTFVFSGWETPPVIRRSEAALVDNHVMESGFQCAGCGEWNVTSVDETAGSRQNYVEDCQVCCKPNVLQVEYDNGSQEFFITAALE